MFFKLLDPKVLVLNFSLPFQNLLLTNVNDKLIIKKVNCGKP